MCFLSSFGACKHTQVDLFRHEAARRGTFPPGGTDDNSAAILAKRGCIHMGSNTIRCAFCGAFNGRVNDLDRRLHVLHHPNCSFPQLNIPATNTVDVPALCIG
ncbi:hypothetical protein BaRGS_00018085 [Batillaria attramentaria]|uniref:Uncharacterized protein n=1 Tax=Batillaria attramentaria TaxID=370345 RepID=A0ABD0KUN8_9CAEN